MTSKIEIIGVVIGVEYIDDDGTLATPDTDFVMSQFRYQGYNVQAVTGPGIDGFYRVEVLTA